MQNWASNILHQRIRWKKIDDCYTIRWYHDKGTTNQFPGIVLHAISRKPYITPTVNKNWLESSPIRITRQNRPRYIWDFSIIKKKRTFLSFKTLNKKTYHYTKVSQLTLFCFFGENPQAVAYSAQLEWLRYLLSSPLTGEKYGKMEPKYPWVVTAKVFYLLREWGGSLNLVCLIINRLVGKEDLRKCLRYVGLESVYYFFTCFKFNMIR